MGSLVKVSKIIDLVEKIRPEVGNDAGESRFDAASSIIEGFKRILLPYLGDLLNDSPEIVKGGSEWKEVAEKIADESADVTMDVSDEIGAGVRLVFEKFEESFMALAPEDNGENQDVSEIVSIEDQLEKPKLNVSKYKQLCTILSGLIFKVVGERLEEYKIDREEFKRVQIRRVPAVQIGCFLGFNFERDPRRVVFRELPDGVLAIFSRFGIRLETLFAYKQPLKKQDFFSVSLEEVEERLAKCPQVPALVKKMIGDKQMRAKQHDGTIEISGAFGNLGSDHYWL